MPNPNPVNHLKLRARVFVVFMSPSPQCQNIGLFLAPVGRNDARASVFRPMETLQNVRFPARLSRKLSCGVGVGWDGMLTFVAHEHMSMLGNSWGWGGVSWDVNIRCT